MLEGLDKFLNVYWKAYLGVGVMFLVLALTIESLVVFTNEQVTKASASLIVAGFIGLFINNILSNLSRQIDETNDPRPRILERMGRWRWTSLIYLVHCAVIRNHGLGEDIYEFVYSVTSADRSVMDQITVRGTAVIHGRHVDPPVVSVPEPTTLGLLAAGLLGFAFRRKKAA